MSHAAAAAPTSERAAADDERAQTASLDRALVRGIAWTGTLKWGGQLISWLATLAVARALTPADYGVYAMALMFLGLITLLSEFGIGSAIVMLRDLADEEVAQINSLAVMFGIAGFATSCAAAVPLGEFFSAPELPAVVATLSVAFIITGFRTVPYSLLQKELRFKWVAVVDATQTLVSAACMVVFAVLGFRYWAFVVGALTGVTVSTAQILASRRHGFAWPRTRSLNEAITFSRHVVVSRVAYFVYGTADQFIAGKMWGSSALGAYSLAALLAVSLPERITSLMLNVTPSIFSTVQDKAAALRRYLLSITEGLALIVFPATLGLAAVADGFVLSVLGEKWREMVAPLQILAAYVGFRTLAPLPAQVLTAIGETRVVMWMHMLALVVLPAAFYVGSQWGSAGVAAGWIVAHPAVSLIVYRRVFKRIELSPRQYLSALLPALSGSLVMVLAVWAVGRMLPSGWPPLLQLGIQVVTGLAVYLLAILSRQQHRARIFGQTWRLLRT